jgi:hypothetical protein
MRVITHDGKEGVVVRRLHRLKQDLVKFNNGVEKWYATTQLTELKADQPTKPPSRAHDHLLLTIQAIEGMHKTASESKTDFAQGAEMAYSLVLDMLNKLK